MSQDYKGFTIPSYTDTADAVRAFMDLVDDIDAQPSEIPPQAGFTDAMLTTDGTQLRWGKRVYTSLAAPTPSDGRDGDVWIQYV